MATIVSPISVCDIPKALAISVALSTTRLPPIITPARPMATKRSEVGTEWLCITTSSLVEFFLDAIAERTSIKI